MKPSQKLAFIVKSFILFLFPLTLFAQPRRGPDVTGAWTGYVKTRDKKITYEAVITRNGEELTGYSKIIFENKGEETYAIKSLSISIQDDKYILEEDSLLFDNFKDEAPRKIKQVNTLDLQIGTKKMLFSGTFKTKATMGLKAATGEVSLQKSIVPDSSLLFVELGSMGIKENLSFVKEAKEAERVAKIEQQKKDSLAAIAAMVKAEVPPPPPAPKPAPPVIKPVPVVAKVSTPVATPSPAPSPTAPPKPAAAKPTPPPVVVRTQKPMPIAGVEVASNINKRELEMIQTVTYHTDSLIFTLYDNGEVDGDTVSVVVNGRVFMGKKGLSTQPVTETLYITPDLGDSLQVVMYAESLGTIPPNTGLLIVQDGRDRHEIRFSGDLKKNAAITFHKRKQEE